MPNIIKPYIKHEDLAKIAKEAPIVAETTKTKTEQTPQIQTPQTQVDAQDIDDFIYVPPINLYVAKERSLNGLKWNQTIDEIYTKGITIEGIRAEMPTPFEFMSFLEYLLSGRINGLAEKERKAIINDILKAGGYRGNHLNAKFIEGTGFNNLGIETIILEPSGNPVKKTEPLLPCLSTGWADINSKNSQGLLTKPYGSSYEQGKNVYFWVPIIDSVARFRAGSGRAGLNCDRDPGYSGASLGVRFARKKI